MKTLANFLRILLVIFTVLLAVAAIPGGIMLMVNFFAPPVEQLQGSLFKDFTIPGMALAVIVGGSAVLALIFLIKKSRFGPMLAATSGVIIMFFEFVEVLVIGSPAGAAQIMQIAFFGLGTLLMIASLGTWFLELAAKPQK
jgi:hypothetical protein